MKNKPRDIVTGFQWTISVNNKWQRGEERKLGLLLIHPAHARNLWKLCQIFIWALPLRLNFLHSLFRIKERQTQFIYLHIICNISLWVFSVRKAWDYTPLVWSFAVVGGNELMVVAIKVEHVFNLSTTNCHCEFAHPDTLCPVSCQAEDRITVVTLALCSPSFLSCPVRSVQFVVEIYKFYHHPARGRWGGRIRGRGFCTGQLLWWAPIKIARGWKEQSGISWILIILNK